MIALNMFWMCHTYNLIQMDKEIQAANWDPYKVLNVTSPRMMGDGFNSPQVKKAYKKLAREWHPDKIAQNRSKTDQEKEFAKKKWLDIVRAYECLTDNQKYKNWIEYGNPEGSILAKTIDLAMPSWVLKEENQLYVLVGFFAAFVIVPMLIISQVKNNDPADAHAEVHEDTPSYMSEQLFMVLDKNASKKVKEISNDQWIEVME